MPEQQSSRAQPITNAPITAPYETAIYPYGLGGLNLKDQLDKTPVGQFSRHTNVIHTMDRGLTARPGVTLLATAGTNHHSVRRLSDPENATYTRIWGIDQSLYIGQFGALVAIDGGYSGDPIYLLPHRPPLSGDPWMFVADRSRMRKVRADGLDLPIGLPAPDDPPVATLGNEFRTQICAFEATDAQGPSDAAQWTGVPGADRSTPPTVTDPPTTADIPGIQGMSVQFQTVPGAASLGYNSWWSLARAMDLTILQGGFGPTVEDADIYVLSLNMSHPHLIEELRVYLVCSANFDASILPGTDTDGMGRNSDFYVKAFRQNDFAQFIQAEQAQVDAAETARIRALRDTALANQSASDGWQETQRRVADSAAEIIAATRDPSRSISTQAGGGAHEWLTVGKVGVPLHRSDFERVGSTPLADWATITGIIVFVQTSDNTAISISLDDWYVTGGAGLDSTQPGAQPYDWRYTHYDTRTGCEGNPSPEMDTVDFLDSLRREIFLQPAPYGDADVHQRFYRRGGAIINDWFFVGETSGDGVQFVDQLTDDDIDAAGTVNLDHYEAVPSQDDNGDTVLAQPVPVIFGPVNGLLFALGDPNRPGHLYWCIPNEPDHWPAESNLEVCSPSEELMAGFVAGSQAFLFSREKLYVAYPNLSDAVEVTVTPTACKRGLVSRWAWAIGLGGIFGVAKDGIFVTGGGGEEIISQDIQPIFRGQIYNGYYPVDFAFPNAIRLGISQDILYFQYQGTDGNRYILVYPLLFKFWTQYRYAVDTSYILPDDDSPQALTLIGGKTAGASYCEDLNAYSDGGQPIFCTVRTGTWDLDRPREDKLLGDQIVDADPQGVTLTLQNRLNNESVVNDPQIFTNATGRKRYIFDSFGTTPQRARNISTEITWNSSTARPTLYFLGQSVIPEPDVTLNRATQWDDLGSADESYVTGVTFDCDTGDSPRTIVVERDFGGQILTMDTLTIQTNGRRKVKRSWFGVSANKVRIRPDDTCVPWILYRADWIQIAEPPRIAAWDIHYEELGDQYYTGLDLYCDTGGLEKRIQVSVDGIILNDPFTGLAYFPVTANGRLWRHITLPWGRGHVFHFEAIDNNPGLLYSHKWYLVEEPSEQANFNQAFSVHGSLADKWFKAFLFEVDTFGQSKTIEVQIDGVTVETFGINTNGRQVIHHALGDQRLGRVLRIFPVDGNPGRPYTIVPIFDVEPYSLTRWETQEGDDGYPGYKQWFDGNITLASTADVLLTMIIQRRQQGDGANLTLTYTIPSTVGRKLDLYVPFRATKGVKRKYILTSASAFRLYQEESTVGMLPWGAADVITTHPFGNDDQDVTRDMTVASVAAARSGGGS